MVGKHLKAPLGLTYDLSGDLHGPHRVSGECHHGVGSIKDHSHWITGLKYPSYGERGQNLNDL